MRKIPPLLALFVGACMLNACGGGASTPATPTPAVATHFSVTAPTNVTVGTAFNFTVTALDASNETVSSYSGLVHFTSSDAQATLPPNSALQQGTANFQATLMTSGPQTITATDTSSASITRTSNSIAVSAASAFTPTGSMKTARHLHTATFLQDTDEVLVTGGADVNGNNLASAELFDPTSGTFTPTGSMAVARSRHTATLLIDGRVLVVGGGDGSAELYDPASKTFTLTGGMAAARSGHTATLLNDGSVLVAGGGNATAELYDPNTGSFAPTAGPMASSRINHTATLLPSGKVLIAGGTDSNGSALGELFDPATTTFAPTASGGTDALLLTATLLKDGTVLLAGGEVTELVSGGSTRCCLFGPVSSSIVSLFETQSATFAIAEDMSPSRASHTATRLSDGTVLIAGGATVSTIARETSALTSVAPLASAELFDPSAGTFGSAPNMTTARTDHTATLLGNGSVLLIGGVDASGNVLASAEFYQ